jgi:glycosyltransferase involved in cell wall biosynthesis
MKIAIVAPSPVPFTIGGSENLWWGLLNWINQNTDHQAELIKIPSPERNFQELVSSYQSFSKLDVTHFDLVISGKYPAWMVQHPKHICYMLHRLRGLYDTYHFTGYPKTYHSNDKRILALQELMRKNKERRDSLDVFFEELNELQLKAKSTSDFFQFPGSLIREIVHFLDGISLSQQEIIKYAAISKNVASRQNYFPLNSTIKVIYPPSNLSSFYTCSYDYLFTVSRLDSAKRISLLIQTMQYVKTNIELRIAGTGPDAEALQEMARGDDRIIFLGFVNDKDVIDLYANALAVLYVPYDEDYGLVTIEAMMSGKPVLTTIDSGGPNEFVKNGETGYSVPPNPQTLAECIDYLCEHRNEARQMGLTARKLVSEINWGNAVNQLLDQNITASEKVSLCVPSIRKRQKITVAVTFPIFPPRGGGQSRVFYLYKNLANWFDIELVTFTNNDQAPFRGEIAPNLYETRIPKSTKHQQQEQLIEQKVGVPITDVAMPQLYNLTPDYLEALRKAIEQSDFVIASHPYLLSAIQAVSKKTIWYEAHNTEFELKRQILPNSKIGQKLIKSTHQIEQECCHVGQLIMVCSGDDAQSLIHTYGVDAGKIIEVPNGVDLETVPYISLEERNSRKVKLGLEGSFTALFIGSWHPPNLEAVRYILKIAEELPDVNFLIVGSVGSAFRDEQKTKNVGFMGVVDDETKATILSIADVALNPIESGSGTNLKMLDYLMAGIPVISTQFGVRGIGIENNIHCIVRELDSFPDAITNIRYENVKSKHIRSDAAKQYIKEKFDWQVIAKNFYQEILSRNLID